MEAKKEDIKIYGKLVNVTTENVVADAEQIWDSYYRKNQTAVNRSMRDDFTKFAKNPTFESAVFTGDSTFQGNMAVEKSLSVKGSSTFQDQATFNGTIRAHGTPNGLVVDHKIITNDIEVMGTFQALNIDTNNLVVHNLLKVENGGSFRVDGDTILNNLSVSGTLDVPNATTAKYGSVRLATSPSGQASTDVLTVGLVKNMLQYVLPTSSENNILIYSNGKWVTSAIDQVINSNATINEHIKSITKNTSYTKNEVYTKGDVYNKSEVDSKISSNMNTVYTKQEVYTKSQTYSKSEVTQLLQDLKESILREYKDSCLWQTSGTEFIIPKDSKKINVKAVYVNSSNIEDKIQQSTDQYWEKSGDTLTPITGINNVNAKHFFKN